VDPVRARDPDALASFYDRRAGKVREYCAIICPPQFVDEATFVAFRDFLGRLPDNDSHVDINLDELLWKATRGAAAGRAEIRPEGRDLTASQRSSRRGVAAPDPDTTCLAMPELLAAYASGELRRNGELDRHVVGCPFCRVTATRFRAAEAAFAREPREQPSKAIRRAWLQIAVNGRES
jgi:hypothetical protein